MELFKANKAKNMKLNSLVDKNTLSLNGRKWGTFYIKDIFRFYRGRRLKSEDRLMGEIAYYSASEINNGLTDKISNPLFIEKDALIYTTFGDCFYVKGNFTASDEITILKHKMLNMYNGLFVRTIIQKNRFKYAYGRKAYLNKWIKEKIKLPVDINEEIDWKFMEDYIKDRYCTPDKLLAINEIVSLKDRKWRNFYIKNLFSVEKCKCKDGSSLENGNEITYIGAKKNDNGVMKIVSRDEDLVSKGNGIVFIGNGEGSAGYCIYQSKDFIGSTSLSIGYNEKLNEYNALFLVAILDKERFRYNFGRGWTANRLLNTKIKLPVNLKEEVDWKFMEDYIKSLPYSGNL